MLGEHQRNRYRPEAVQSGNAAASLRFIPNRQPAGTPHGSNPSALPSGTGRCGISPARLSAGCQRAKATLLPGAVVAADTSLPLLVI
jgi:hypothetical protein